MKKAINLYFLSGDTKTKLDNIKAVGYDGVLLGIYDEKETMSLEEQVAYCSKIGLEISMIHCSYDEPKLNYLWIENSEDGNWVEGDLLKQIERIKDLGVKDFVIHTNGSKDVVNSMVGLQHIKALINKCEEYKLNLCIENLYLESQVDYIFNNLNSPNLKFCYDCGHDNFLTPNSSLVKKHAHLLTTTHIHDNNGVADEHLILGSGTIDINKLAQDLSGCAFEYLSAEIKVKDTTISQTEVLRQNLNALNVLDNKILKCKQK